MKRILILALVASLGLAACGKKEEAPKAPAANLVNAARVLQVVPAGTYTYVEAMGETGEKVWMAGAAIDVKPGDNIAFGNYSMMSNYQSKTLNRTFDRVLFVEAWSTGKAQTAVAQHGTMPAGANPGGMATQLPGGHPPMAGGMPGGHPPMAGGAPGAAPAGGGNSGVVKSAQNAGGYSYVEVQQGSGSVWVAAPETKVKAGDKITWDGGMVMNNFNAKSLNRTFDAIVFAGGIKVVQ